MYKLLQKTLMEVYITCRLCFHIHKNKECTLVVGSNSVSEVYKWYNKYGAYHSAGPCIKIWWKFTQK